MATYLPWRTIIYRSCLALGLVSLLFSFSRLADAASYNLHATVPYEAPSQAAVINPALNQSVVNQALVTISGTCQQLDPSGVVSIWRSGSAIGSTICSGTFGLQVMLSPGANNLVARTANASGQYGPDSQAVILTLTLPSKLPSSTNQTIEPSSPASEVISTNRGASSGLKVTTKPPFTVLSNGPTTGVELVISGGKQPYTVELNWGDGSADTRTVDTPSPVSFSHTYSENQTYVLKGRVLDSQGDYAQVNSVAITPQLGQILDNGVKIDAAVSPTTGGDWWKSHVVPVAIATTGVTVIVVGSYSFGWVQAAGTAIKRVMSLRHFKRYWPKWWRK